MPFQMQRKFCWFTPALWFCIALKFHMIQPQRRRSLREHKFIDVRRM
jgi:hypothetical protein